MWRDWNFVTIGKMVVGLVSIENLITFPFVKSAVDKNELTLHGLWTDIAEGSLEQFDSNLKDFVRI